MQPLREIIYNILNDCKMEKHYWRYVIMGIEISPSSRSNCRICNKKIVKGELRFYRKQSSSFEFSSKWTYHVRCVALTKAKRIKDELSGNISTEIKAKLEKK